MRNLFSRIKVRVPPELLLSAVILLFPLLFVPLLANPFDLVKNAFLLLGVLTVVFMVLIRSAREGKLTLPRSPFDGPVLLLPLIAVASAWLSTNRVASLTSDPLLYAGAALLFFLVAYFAGREENARLFTRTLLLSGGVVALWTVVQLVINLLAQSAKRAVPASSFLSLGFAPTGSVLATALFLAVLLPLAVGFKKRLATIVIALGLAATVVILYKNQPIILPAEAGWKVATGSMGLSAQSALLGMGPGNYIDAFTFYKPASLNSTSFWNLRFTAGPNFYFYLLTTLGVTGLAAFIWLAVKVAVMARRNLVSGGVSREEKGLLVSTALGLVLFLVSPAPAVLIAMFYTILGLLAVRVGKTREVVLPATRLKFAPAVVALVATGFLAYHLSRFVLADYYFNQSLVAAGKNQGTQTYNAQIQAINLNSTNDAYHVSYSQTNLALADSLAGQPNLSDQQKQAVVQLVQQAIREGRVAAALAPNRAGNWENLSAIYRSLINFAQGADEWTLSSLNQAIALDPTNPRLRLDLGGLYFVGKDYVSAAQVFNQAVNLKPDLANAHYNLAQALKNLNLNDQALKELQTTSGLVCALGKSADCDRVNAEVEELGASPSATPPEGGAGQQPLATSSAKTLPNIKPNPPVKIASPSGVISP